ncbi:putative pentatricopeptide repeat-containing protein At1g64310 [Silene latifolia]|uniref:putative pentatricopeptide repeat-containing protein At1g64310 n=1 Tax=Silene latifolia TaxID=37657 RepID=UPI003D774DA0
MSIPIRLILSYLSKPHQNLLNTKQLHAMITKTHLSLDPFFATKIIRYYAGNDELSSAHQLFDESPNRSIYLWNSIIRAYAKVHDFGTTFDLFRQLVRSELRPDNFTFACILRACLENDDVNGIRVNHGKVVVAGLDRDSICGSALVTVYAKMGFLDDCRKVFEGVFEPDLGTWNSIINGYGYCGFWEEGLKLFNDMRNKCIRPDGYAIVALLSALSESRLVEIGEGIHSLCVKSGFLSNAHVGSSLVTMYSKCACLDSAHKVFCSLSEPDIVTWSSLITGFANSGDISSAFIFFRDRNMLGMKPDPVLLASILVASVQLVNLGVGCEIHGYVLRHGLETDILVCSALIDMYSKCGNMDLAIQVLNALPLRNIVVYNSAISGLGSHGNPEQAFELFDELLEKGLRPDESTFSAILHACSQSGLVKEGQEYFKRMKDEFGIEPRNEHCVHMVKVLGMVGKLEEAYNFVLSLSEPVDAGIWGALLGCCEMHGNAALAETILHNLFGNQPEEHLYPVLLSKIYANNGRWDDAEKVRNDLTDRGDRKVTGFSWIGR